MCSSANKIWVENVTDWKTLEKLSPARHTFTLDTIITQSFSKGAVLMSSNGVLRKNVCMIDSEKVIFERRILASHGLFAESYKVNDEQRKRVIQHGETLREYRI